jgi:hypothetical protein
VRTREAYGAHVSTYAAWLAERPGADAALREPRIARFRDPGDRDLARLKDLLVVSALEHDSPLALLRTAALEIARASVAASGALDA